MGLTSGPSNQLLDGEGIEKVVLYRRGEQKLTQVAKARQRRRQRHRRRLPGA